MKNRYWKFSVTQFKLAVATVVSISVLVGSGCSVLIGNVRPVDEKSQSYGVEDLAQNNSDWVKLDPKLTSPEAKDSDLTSTEASDVAYQSKETAAIISLNSACRKHLEEPEQSLRTLTNLLLLGMTDVTLHKEEPESIQNTPALRTTVEGKLNGEPMMLRTVVLRRATCIYDLVYMSRPKSFDLRSPDFNRFVSSLKLK